MQGLQKCYSVLVVDGGGRLEQRREQKSVLLPLSTIREKKVQIRVSGSHGGGIHVLHLSP